MRKREQYKGFYPGTAEAVVAPTLRPGKESLCTRNLVLCERVSVVCLGSEVCARAMTVFGQPRF